MTSCLQTFILGDQMCWDWCEITPKSGIASALITYYFNNPVQNQTVLDFYSVIVI